MNLEAFVVGILVLINFISIQAQRTEQERRIYNDWKVEL